MMLVGLTNGQKNSDVVVNLDAIPEIGIEISLSPSQIVWSLNQESVPNYCDCPVEIVRERGIGDFNNQNIRWFQVQPAD